MKREKQFMIDIETTGVERNKDTILQVGLLELEFNEYWQPTGRELDITLYSDKQPETEFAKKHMVALYEKCNKQDKNVNFDYVRSVIRQFIHQPTNQGIEFYSETPKLFMGWNASTFDIPFMFDYGLLKPSYYAQVDGKETLCGDVHYRIYEQTGSVQLACDVTGLDRKTIEVLAMDLNPTNLKLPKGKEHDALYDCYRQTIIQNGLIKIMRMAIKK